VSNQEYRIIKLKTGESLITEVKALTGHSTMVIDQPMIFKTMTVPDPQGNGLREFLIIKDWLEYCSQKTVEIPCESVLIMTTPDEKMTSVYEFEKQKTSITPEEAMDMLKDISEKGLDGTNQNNQNSNLHNVNIQLQLDQNASMDFLELLGIDFVGEDDEDNLEDLSDEELEDMIKEMEKITEETSKQSKNNNKKSKSDVPWGNSYEDWSADPNDYLN
jgi:hypothetical protein